MDTHMSRMAVDKVFPRLVHHHVQYWSRVNVTTFGNPQLFTKCEKRVAAHPFASTAVVDHPHRNLKHLLLRYAGPSPNADKELSKSQTSGLRHIIIITIDYHSHTQVFK